MDRIGNSNASISIRSRRPTPPTSYNRQQQRQRQRRRWWRWRTIKNTFEILSFVWTLSSWFSFCCHGLFWLLQDDCRPNAYTREVGPIAGAFTFLSSCVYFPLLFNSTAFKINYAHLFQTERTSLINHLIIICAMQLHISIKWPKPFGMRRMMWELQSID